MDVTGAGPQTSECTNSRGFEAWKVEIGNENWCILPLKQCLQWGSPLSLCDGQEIFKEDKATSRTLLLGWPILWCHKDQLFALFAGKAAGKRDSVETGCCFEDDSGLTWGRELMKFLE